MIDRRNFLGGIAFAGLAGCADKMAATRAKLDEPAVAKSLATTIGDVSIFDNAMPLPVSGVGLVFGLPGTGGPAPDSDFKKMLVRSLEIRKVPDIGTIMKSRDVAMVFVSANLQPGVRKGDSLDLEVSLPDGSLAKSLRSGYLGYSEMMTFDTSDNIRQYLKSQGVDTTDSTSSRLVKGHILAHGEGPVLPDLARMVKAAPGEDPDGKPIEAERWNEGDLKRGVVWGGGRSRVPRMYYLSMNPDYRRFEVVMTAARRLNETFSTPGNPDKIAKELDKTNVMVGIPHQYRLNVPHFLLVIRKMPLEKPSANSEYVQALRRQLEDTATTLDAALRLEALGKDGVVHLKEGLNSKFPLVRFASAESLAYLGEATAADELALAADEHPSVRAYCLSALAALDDSRSSDKLEGLTSARAPDLRYGAFRALREMDPRHPAVQSKGAGEGNEKAFHVHELPASDKGLVHALSNKRPEIVLFGKSPALVGPVALRVGEFTITHKTGDSCTVKRFPKIEPGREAASERIEQCEPKVADLCLLMGRMGAAYDDVLEALRQLNQTGGLSCPFRLDAIPAGLPLKILAEKAVTDPDMLNEAEWIEKAKAGPGERPGLFEPAPTGA